MRLLFFSMEPDKYIPCAQIDVVEFPEGVGGDRIEEKIVSCPLSVRIQGVMYMVNEMIKSPIALGT